MRAASIAEPKRQEKSIEAYSSIPGSEGMIEQTKKLAGELQGAKILHISSTDRGGGVAEILRTLVPLMQDLGLAAEWQVMEAEDEFFDITKAFHNALQGMKVPITNGMVRTYLHYNRLNARQLRGEYDFVVVHDPPPAALKHFVAPCKGCWVWRCHLDSSRPSKPVVSCLKPYLTEYDVAIFTLEEYEPSDLSFNHTFHILPSIDPFTAKNKELSLEECHNLLARFAVDLDRPLLLEVARFDPWKDQLGVIDVYRLVKLERPEVQLALIGAMTPDDPEGWSYYAKTMQQVGKDHDIHILSDVGGVGDKEVNAFQTIADVVIQKSTREAFGLAVTEALWKRQPVIGGNVGGIRRQIKDGRTGFLVDSVEECARRSLFLLNNPEQAEEMGKHAREHVRESFLSIRHLRDYLRLFVDLSSVG